MTEAPRIKRMALRRDGVCACGTRLPAGTRAGWDTVAKVVICLSCLDGTDAARMSARTAGDPVPPVVAPTMPAPPAPDVAGGSAQARYERLAKRREDRIRAAHPRLGRLIVAITDDPQSTKAWASGSDGERRVAARLEEIAGDEVLVLHDRRIPGSRANIDHIAIGPSGVFVIDAKRYNNAEVTVRRTGGLLRPVTEQLMVNKRDRTKLVDGLAPQLVAVYTALDGLPGAEDVNVSGVLCFVDAYLPRFGTLTVDGVPILGPKATAKLVAQPGPCPPELRTALHGRLAAHLKPMPAGPG